MAKMFYTAKEAAERLGKSEDELRVLVREGTLREFRDAGKVNYKVEDIEELSPDGEGGSSASSTGEVVLEPVEDSGIELAPSGSDVLSLEEVDPSDETAGGATGSQAAKEGSVVPSVGVNVFDDDDLDEIVDPLAQTAVTDVGGLGLDGSGSGSGIMNLSRESDDTSLGAELLEEIYSGETEGEGEGGQVEMGDATRAGLEEAIPEPVEPEETEEVFKPTTETATPATGGRPQVEVTRVVEYGPDAVSSALTGAMVLAVLVMCVAGMAAAAMVRGLAPSLVRTIYDNLMVFTGAAAGVAALAGAVTFFVAKRSA